jgi:hypothetical protein
MTLLPKLPPRLSFQALVNVHQLVMEVLNSRLLMVRITCWRIQGATVICTARPHSTRGSTAYLFEIDAKAAHRMMPVIKYEWRILHVTTGLESAPNAPMASSRSASCTQCSSMQLSCHPLHCPLPRSFFSVVHETLSMILATNFARPSEMRSTWCSVDIRSKKGKKNPYGSPAWAADTYFLSSTSWRSAANSTVKRSGLEFGLEEATA